MLLRISLVLCFSILISPCIQAADSSAKKGLEIAKKSDKANSGFRGDKSDLEMILINAHGDKITRKLESQTKEMKKDGDKSIITFNWPADVKGTKLLTWSHKKKDDDQWIYLPALRRVKRITSSTKTGSFMGSEFSYEDLGSQEIEKFKYKFIKEGNYQKRPVWIIERFPKDKNSGYTKQRIWMDKGYVNPVKLTYYDLKGELLKTAHFQKYKKIKKWWRPYEVKIVNHQTKKKSIMKWNKIKLGLRFSHRDFAKENLK